MVIKHKTVHLVLRSSVDHLSMALRFKKIIVGLDLFMVCDGIKKYKQRGIKRDIKDVLRSIWK